MKTFNFILLLTVVTSLHCDTWNPVPPAQIPNSSSSGSGTFSSVNTTTGEFLVTWTDNFPSDLPIYATFNGFSWSIPTAIPNSSRADTTIASSFNSSSGQFLVTWGGLVPTLAFPFFATYDGAAWSLPSQIPGSLSSASAIFNSSNPNAGTYLATWMDGNSTNPFYAVYNGTVWNTPSQIPGSVSAESDVYSTYDPVADIFLVTWLDGLNIPSLPYFVTYNGSTWSTPAPIPNSSAASSDVWSSVNTSGSFLVTWIDESSGAPAFATFDGNTWSMPSLIPNGTLASSDIVSSYDPLQNLFLVTWGTTTGPSGLPTYALFDGSTWTMPLPIPQTSTSNFDINSSFSVPLKKFLVSWQDTSTFPFYTTLSFQTSPSTPGGFTGVQKTNQFLLQAERYNILSWQANQDASGYYLYRNNILIATLEGNILSFIDHNQTKQSVTYSLIAFNSFGNSPPAVITVNSTGQ